MVSNKCRSNRQEKPKGAEADKKARNKSGKMATGTGSVSSEAADASTLSNGTPDAPEAVEQGTLPLFDGSESQVVASASPADTLQELAAQIRDAVDEAQTLAETVKESATTAVVKARRAGELLIEAKRRVGHGGWQDWIGEHLPGVSQETVCRYMRLAANLSRVTDLASLGSLTSAYRAVGILPERSGNGQGGDRQTGAKAIIHDRIRRESDPDASDAGDHKEDDRDEPIDQDAVVGGKETDCAPTAADESETESPIGRLSLEEQVEGFVQDAVRLREKGDRIWQVGVRLTPRQSKELHATEEKLRKMREAMGGEEGKRLSKTSRGGR